VSTVTRSLLIHGGPIMTMNRAMPAAQAVGIVNKRIVAVGDVREVRAELGATVEEIDLDGRTAVPGFYDAHAHVMGVGYAESQIDLTPDAVDSIAAIAGRVRERAAAAPEGTWILGRGYDQAMLAEGRFPTRQDLDAAASDHPVVLRRMCHHIISVNSKALELAGITRSTPDPDDGTIDRDEHGEPTGVLREAAANAIWAVMDDPSEDDILDALKLGGRIFREHGVTSVAEAGIARPEELRAYQRAHASGDLALRTWLMMLIDDTLDELISLGIMSGFGDEWMRIGNAKLYTDGSIGGKTARMSEPYAGEPDNYGIYMYPPEEIIEKLLRAHKAGFQLGNHAIGDAAISVLLDAYERAQREHPVPDPRFRIEHCSILSAPMIHRIRALGAIPIPGTTFLYDMRPVYLANLGEERVRYAYAMKTFAERGIIAAASTDAPVSGVNPMVGIGMMVSRTDRLGDEIFPVERVSLEEAIRAYTWNGAYASFSEKEKGSLEPGKLGDLAILETDLSNVAPTELRNVRCDMTVVSGEVVYERPS
jgi:predicted amidohydrolase YtcJ